jgi:uncharacterized protein YdhG (YjbR/CyaY superfamily)
VGRAVSRRHHIPARPALSRPHERSEPDIAKDTPPSVDAYLASLPDDRRAVISAVRDTILKNLPDGYTERIQYNMIGYAVPHTIYPAGYHCNPAEPLPFISLASQKNHMAIYMFCLYTDASAVDAFVDAWTKTGKKLDMGKSCVRFKRIEDVALDVIGDTVKRVPVEKFIAAYEAARDAPRPQRKVVKKNASKPGGSA